MQPNERSDGTSAEQSQEMLLQIGRGLREAFAGCLSEPLPSRLDELIGLIRSQADKSRQAAHEEPQ